MPFFGSGDNVNVPGTEDLFMLSVILYHLYMQRNTNCNNCL